jgi:hypothetical protein
MVSSNEYNQKIAITFFSMNWNFGKLRGSVIRVGEEAVQEEQHPAAGHSF